MTPTLLLATVALLAWLRHARRRSRELDTRVVRPDAWPPSWDDYGYSDPEGVERERAYWPEYFDVPAPSVPEQRRASE